LGGLERLEQVSQDPGKPAPDSFPDTFPDTSWEGVWEAVWEAVWDCFPDTFPDTSWEGVWEGVWEAVPDCFPDWFLGTSLDTTPDHVLTQVWVSPHYEWCRVGGSNPCWCDAVWRPGCYQTLHACLTL
jgi:hypothetical protein